MSDNKKDLESKKQAGSINEVEKKDKEVCGIIMPISALDGCTDMHWSEVQKILNDSIEDAGFAANLVSNSDDATLIHKTILQNLYDNPVAVCDVSGKNPNVMFELGLRLAFDKPTIIIKDDRTSYSFDTAGIEHIEYPRDLRFSKIVEFKSKLTEKISATYQRSISDPNYTTFLKHFGEFKVAKIDKREVSSQELILDELKSLKNSIYRMEKQPNYDNRIYSNEIFGQQNESDYSTYVCLRSKTLDEAKDALLAARKLPFIKRVTLRQLGSNHFHLNLLTEDDSNTEQIEQILGGRCRHIKRNSD